MYSDVPPYMVQYLDARGVHRTKTFYFAANRENFLSRHGAKLTNVIRSTWDQATLTYIAS